MTRTIRVTMVTAAMLLASVCADAEVRKPYVISGYDDVLRQSNNTGALRAAKKLLSKDASFAGMPELYRILANGDSDFAIVSATSSRFTDGARELLKKEGYPPSVLHFRSWLTDWSAVEFKNARIMKLVNDNPGRQFIVVLDNSDSSVSLSARLFRDQPTKWAAIYLRETVQRDPAPSTVSYITAFDIAANEFLQGRMSRDDLALVAKAVIGEEQSSRLVPDYAFCPTDYDPCKRNEPQLRNECAPVRAKVRALCESRNTR